MMDLFTPLPTVYKLNENLSSYIQISSENSKNIIRDWFDGFVDRDNKFVFEFQTSFEGMLADDIQDVLKDLLSGTTQSMMEAEMNNRLDYVPYERTVNLMPVIVL